MRQRANIRNVDSHDLWSKIILNPKKDNLENGFLKPEYLFKHCRALEAGIDYKLMKDYSESLMVDEMKLKQGLAYNRSTGKLSGYVSIGESCGTINQEN